MRCTLLVAAALLLVSGCKQNGAAVPLVEAEEQHFDDRVVGTWYPMEEVEGEPEQLRPNRKMPLEITRQQDEGYRAVLHDDEKGKKWPFDVQLVQLGEHHFFQARRPDFDSNTDDDGYGVIRIYYFGRYRVTDEELEIQFASTKELQKQLKAAELPFVDTEEALLVTATRQQLCDFLEEHADQLFQPNQPLRKADSLPDAAAKQRAEESTPQP